MDPIASVNLKKDSTLAMIRAALTRGWRVSYLEQRDLTWKDDHPMATLRDLSIEADFLADLDPERAGTHWYQFSTRPPRSTCRRWMS